MPDDVSKNVQPIADTTDNVVPLEDPREADHNDMISSEPDTQASPEAAPGVTLSASIELRGICHALYTLTARDPKPLLCQPEISSLLDQLVQLAGDDPQYEQQWEAAEAARNELPGDPSETPGAALVETILAAEDDKPQEGTTEPSTTTRQSDPGTPPEGYELAPETPCKRRRHKKGLGHDWTRIGWAGKPTLANGAPVCACCGTHAFRLITDPSPNLAS